MSTVSLEKPSEDGSGKCRVNERFTAWQAGSLSIAENKVCGGVRVCRLVCSN